MQRRIWTVAKTLTEEYAGPLYQATLCTRCRRSDTPAQRAQKRNRTSEKQKLLNQKNAWRLLMRQLAANFPTAGSAIIATLTYDDRYLPKYKRPGACRDKVSEHIRSFLKRLRKARAAAGLPEPVAFYSIEVLTSGSGRWHVHLVLDNTGHDYDTIRKAWIYGSTTDFCLLRTDKEKNWETQAKYMTKESRECQDDLCKPGLKSWSHTKNIKKPERITRIVPDSYVIPIPKGAVEVRQERADYDYGEFIYVSYWQPEGWKTGRPRARRKPRTL